MDKKIFRKKMFRIISAQTSEQRKLNSDIISEKVFQLPEWKNANTIGITISQETEIDTRKLIERAWEEGKKVAIPKCISKERRMDFYIFTNDDQLEVVYFNLKEPNVDKTQFIHNEQIDLLIVPGLAFTRKGERIGFGGGYYDRFLANFVNSYIVLAFECQLVENIPMEEHDIRIPKIITENNIFLNQI